MQSSFTPRQWAIVLLIAAVQFVNVLDFVIIMPLGPLLADALAISEAHLGYLNGSYTAAAAISGLLGSLFLDRFDRRKALAVAMGGLVLGTIAGGAAVDLPTLMLTRVVAGAFGGPATSLAFSIIADSIPVQLRGRAMGTVMGAFSLASVLGVPAGLWAAETFSWGAPFLCVGGIGFFVVLAAIAFLPPMTGHLDNRRQQVGFRALLSRPIVQLSYLMTAAVMTAGFVLIPNIAAYMQLNLSFPRELIKYAYMFGGVMSLVATQLGGRLVDRLGSFRVGAVGTTLTVVTVYVFFFRPLSEPPAWAVYLSFTMFMFANGLRNVSYNTLTSKVVEPEVRARFQSLQSAVQHGAAAMAAILSAQLLSKGPRPADWPGTTASILIGMSTVAAVCMLMSATIPLLILVVEGRLTPHATVLAPVAADRT